MNINEAIRDSKDPTKHPSEWVPHLIECLKNRSGRNMSTRFGRPNIDLVRIKQLVYTWLLYNQAHPCPYHDCEATTSQLQASSAAGRRLNPLGGQFDEHWTKCQDNKYACPQCSRPMEYSVGVRRGPYWECLRGE